MKIFKIFFIFFIIVSILYTDNQIEANKKKKIVFVKDDNSDFFNGFADFIGKEFEKNGWTNKNSEYIVLSMEGKIEKIKENTEEIKRINPDVVYMNGVYPEKRFLPLLGTGIPVVNISNVDFKIGGKYALLDKNKNPISNITGMIQFPENFISYAIDMLNNIHNIDGKKVVVLYQQGLVAKEEMEKILSSKGIKLKFFKEYEYFEDFQVDLLKYNEDNEVGWILVDGPITRKDGKEWNRKDTFLWEHTNIKKPNIAFYQNNVENGALSGLAVDPMGYVLPSLQMCYRILNGEKPQDIKPIYPEKTYILLNIKAAKQIGIEIPLDIMGAAWRVYTDYEGNYVGIE